MSLTAAEMAELKQQLKDELLAEMKNPPKKPLNVWKEIRTECIDPILDGLKRPISSPARYQLESAMSAIIRNRFNIHSFSALKDSDRNEARQIANLLARLIKDGIGAVKE